MIYRISNALQKVTGNAIELEQNTKKVKYFST